MEQFEQRSVVHAPADVVWERAVTAEGINDELMPVFRMTMPKSLRGKTVADIRPGERPGKAWILLFGVIPIDYDDLGIDEIETGHFLERSTMLSMKRWEHERTVRAVDGGTEVHDRLAFEMRPALAWIPGIGTLFRHVFVRVFRHRHRRLARRFG